MSCGDIMQYFEQLKGLHDMHDALDGGFKVFSEISRFRKLESTQMVLKLDGNAALISESVITQASDLDSKVSSHKHLVNILSKWSFLTCRL